MDVHCGINKFYHDGQDILDMDIRVFGTTWICGLLFEYYILQVACDPIDVIYSYLTYLTNVISSKKRNFHNVR